jgi:endonuclease YncB( thermonuclease family)
MAAMAADIVGRVTRVVDGDTFDVTSPNDGDVRIRLCGMESPKSGDPNFRLARRFLSEKIEKRKIRCIRVGEGTVCDDRSKPTNKGKIVAQCFIGNEDVAAIMIKAGMACDWPKFSGGHYHGLSATNACSQTKQ